jgi:hypothetical protein
MDIAMERGPLGPTIMRKGNAAIIERKKNNILR